MLQWAFFALVFPSNLVQKLIKYVEKILKGNLNSIPSPSLKIQIMGGKVCLRCKGKTLLGVVNKLLKQKVCQHSLAMVCLIISSKLSRQKFEISLNEKMMGSNPGYLLKSFLLYKGPIVPWTKIFSNNFFFSMKKVENFYTMISPYMIQLRKHFFEWGFEAFCFLIIRVCYWEENVEKKIHRKGAIFWILLGLK